MCVQPFRDAAGMSDPVEFVVTFDRDGLPPGENAVTVWSVASAADEVRLLWSADIDAEVVGQLAVLSSESESESDGVAVALCRYVG